MKLCRKINIDLRKSIRKNIVPSSAICWTEYYTNADFWYMVTRLKDTKIDSSVNREIDRWMVRKILWN